MTSTETTKTNPYYFKVLALLAAVAVTASLLVTSAAKPAHALTTFTVNSTGDEDDAAPLDGHCDVDLTTPGDQCTLRAALHETHFSPEAQEIDFNILGSGVHTIEPSSALPDIGPNTQVIINGYTQPGASQNTLEQGDNAVLNIELDGSNLGLDDDGLRISDFSRGSVIKGLVIRNFGNNGIHLSGQGNRVEGNFIGTDASATTAKPTPKKACLSSTSSLARRPPKTPSGATRPPRATSSPATLGAVCRSKTTRTRW